jgi:predicted RNA-binding Zn-ribbon protein involved in translation (DUF1610 family)
VEETGEFHLVPVCVLEIPAFPITLCPPGIAEGAFLLRNRGHDEFGEITCWPKQKQFPFLNPGHEVLDPIRTTSRAKTRLWDQEMYVYLRERKGKIIDILDHLGEYGYLPRPASAVNNMQVMEEDFYCYCLACNFKWEPEDKGMWGRYLCPNCKERYWWLSNAERGMLGVLKACRKNLTVDEYAELLGLSHTSLDRILEGRQAATPAIVNRALAL